MLIRVALDVLVQFKRVATTPSPPDIPLSFFEFSRVDS